MKMPKTTVLLLLFLGLMAAFLGYNYYFRPFYQPAPPTAKSDSGSVFMASDSAGLSAVELIFNRFSDKGRVAQLIAWPLVIGENGVVPAAGLTQDEFLTEISKKQPGLVTIFGEQISTISAKQAIKEVASRNQSVLPAWIAVDHEGGKVQRLNGEGFTKLASWHSFCGADQMQAQKVLLKSALELKEVGVNVVLAPVLDVGLPRGAMEDRLCSNKPELIVDRVNLYISTFKELGIWPVVKHFPGIGKISPDLHSQFSVGRVGVEDVYVYRSILNRDSNLGVMTAHIGLENQFADIPCSLSPDCVGELTTNYPNALVFADALEMKSAAWLPVASRSAEKKELSLEEVSIKAVMAGNDVLLFGPSVDFEQLSSVYDMLNEAYRSDFDFKKRVDESVKKIISYKLGLTNEIATPSASPQ